MAAHSYFVRFTPDDPVNYTLKTVSLEQLLIVLKTETIIVTG